MYEEFDEIVIPWMLDLIIDMIRHASLDLNEVSSTIATRAICSIYVTNYNSNPEIENKIAQYVMTASDAINTLHQTKRDCNIYLNRVRRCQIQRRQSVIICDTRRHINMYAQKMFGVKSNVYVEVCPDISVDIDLLLIYTFLVTRVVLIEIQNCDFSTENIVEEACVRMSYMFDVVEFGLCKHRVSRERWPVMVYHQCIIPWLCAFNERDCSFAGERYVSNKEALLAPIFSYGIYSNKIGSGFDIYTADRMRAFNYVEMLKHILCEIRNYADISGGGNSKESQKCDEGENYISFRLKLL